MLLVDEGPLIAFLITRDHAWELQREALQQGLKPFMYVFERRLGRPLCEREQKRIALRLETDGPKKLGSVVLDLSPEELAAWLAPRRRRHPIPRAA